MIDLSKEYVTKRGLEVRLAGINPSDEGCPVKGHFVSEDGYFTTASWTLYGEHSNRSSLDLIEKPRTVEIPEQFVMVSNGRVCNAEFQIEDTLKEYPYYKIPAQTLTEVRRDEE